MLSKAIDAHIEDIQKTNENASISNKNIAQIRLEWDQERIRLEKKLNEERNVNIKINQEIDDLKVLKTQILFIFFFTKIISNFI